MTDILDITDIFYFPWAEIIVVSVGIGLFLAFLSLMIWWIWKRRRQTTLSHPPLSPDEEARAALKALLEKNHVEKGEFRKFYFGLDEIFRQYLFRRYALAAPEMTPREVLIAIRQNPEIPHSLLKNIPVLLQRTELAKFAGFKPSTADCESDSQEVRSFCAA